MATRWHYAKSATKDMGNRYLHGAQQLRNLNGIIFPRSLHKYHPAVIKLHRFTWIYNNIQYLICVSTSERNNFSFMKIQKISQWFFLKMCISYVDLHWDSIITSRKFEQLYSIRNLIFFCGSAVLGALVWTWHGKKHGRGVWAETFTQSH